MDTQPTDATGLTDGPPANPFPSFSIGPPNRISTRVSRLLTIDAGHSISLRRSWSNLTVTVIGGKCRIEIADQAHLVSACECLDIPAHLDHQIFGITNLRAVVSFDAMPPQL